MPKPEPKFSEGDLVWFEDSHLGDRPAKIREVNWESYTETWTYKHRLCNRCIQPVGYNSEAHYRHRED